MFGISISLEISSVNHYTERIVESSTVGKNFGALCFYRKTSEIFAINGSTYEFFYYRGNQFRFIIEENFRILSWKENFGFLFL